MVDADRSSDRLFDVVYALDAATGDTVWTAGDQFGQIIASPVVAGGVVYVGYNSGLVQALDADTSVTLWDAQAGASIYSSPAVAGDRLFVASNDGKVQAFDAGSGNELGQLTQV
jgi:eukaryotic-like serine/threonine-protein kinase